MARTLSSQAVFHQLTGVYRLDDLASPAPTTTDGTANKGTKDVDIQAGQGTNYAAGDYVRIGANGDQAEVNVVASVATDTITMELPFSRAIASGEAFTKLTRVDLGATDENGVSLETTQGETAIVAGTQKKTYLYINQNIEEQMSFALRDFDRENVLASMGYDETDTDIFDTNGVVLPLDDAVSQSYQPWCFEGLLEDATTVTALVFSAKVASANQTLQFAEGTATAIPFALRSNGNRSFLFA